MTTLSWLNEDHRTGYNPVETPLRRRFSVRRTTSVDSSFPQGKGHSAAVAGRARDLFTDADGQAHVVAAAKVDLRLDAERIVHDLVCVPPVLFQDDLVGHSTLRGWRKRLRPLIATHGLADAPVAQLLDDLVGVSVVHDWIWTRTDATPQNLEARVARQQNMDGACWSYSAQSNAFDSHDHFRRLYYVPPLEREDDPLGFHEMPAEVEATQRRSRRIDLWVENDGSVGIDAMFQDSGIIPGNHRIAIHEYRIFARARPVDHDESLRVFEMATDPGVLPHPECRFAPHSLMALVGLPLADLRNEVSSRLSGSLGCTHLNDAVRALSSVPALVSVLDRYRAGR